MSSSLSRASPPPASPPSRKPQHKLPSSLPLHVSAPVIARVVDSATTDVEAEKSKKILEWELSALEADDLRSHAWYHGQHVNRAEAERLLRQCVAEEHCSDSTSIRQHVEENNSDSDSDGLEDINSESSDTDFAFEDFLDDLVDERGMVPDPSLATSTTMAAALLLQQRRRMDGVLLTNRPKRPHRQRRHFYCFLVRDSLNVRPPGRYVVSCLRVDKYEDREAGEKYKTPSFGSDNERKRKKFIRRQRQRRQRRQQRHPVLHFVINEIILQPRTVYERSQFSFGETLPSMATAISTGGMNNNAGLNGQQQCQPGFDSVPDLIRYYVGGADDNAVLSYGCGNDGIVSGSMTLSRVPQTEVRIRYPCNRRRPLITSNTLDEAVTPNILPVTIETSRLVRQHCRALSAVSTCFGGGSTEASTSSQNTNRHRPPSPPPQPSKWMRVQSSSRSSIRRTPSATVTSAMVTSASSLKPDSTAESANQFQSKTLALSLSPPSIDPRSLSTVSTSASLVPTVTTLPRLARSPQDLTKISSGHFINEIASTSIQTLPCQSKSSPPLTPTSGFVSSSSTQRSLTSKTKSIWDQPSTSLGHTTITSNTAMPSKITSNLTISELLASPLSIPPQPVHELPMQSEASLFNYFMMSSDKPTGSKPGSTIDMDAEIAAALSSEESNRINNNSRARTADIFSIPYERVVRSSFIRVRVRNGYHSQYERNCAPFESQQDTPNSFTNLPMSHNSSPESHFHISDSPRSRSKRCWVRSESYIPKNSQNKDGSSENKTDAEQHHQQETFSPVSSSISTSTLKNEVMKSNRQKAEHIVDQPRPDEHHFTDKQPVCSYNVTHDERDIRCLVPEVKDSLKNIEVKHQSLEKNRALDDLVNIDVDQIVSDDQKIPEPHSSVKQLSSVPFENQNFQERRTRWTNKMRQGLVDMLDKPLMDHQNQQLTQILGTHNCDPRQRCLRPIDQAQNEKHLVNHLMETIAKDIETRQPMLCNSTNQATIMSPFVANCVTSNSAINLSNNDLTENMIRQWVDLQGTSMRSRNSSVVVVYGGNILPQIEMLPHIRRGQLQNHRLVFTSGDHQLPARVDLPSESEFNREHMTLSGDAELPLKKNMNYPQVNRIMTSHSSINQEGGIATVTRDSKLSINGSISDINCPNTTTTPFSTDDQLSSTRIYGLEIGNDASGVCGIGCELACDYENINPINNDHNNSFDKGRSQNNYNNHLDWFQISNNQDQKKNQASKPQINDNFNNFIDNTAAIVDYENITTHNTDDTNDFNYENIGKNSAKKPQQLNHSSNGGSTAVAAALRAVHLAIIGDPDDSGGATTVGTGRLAASLCRADGRATVLPYPRNSTESEQVGPLMSMCPLQLLGQPGPEGRRARLDVIERFACLQYLVAMTVIVTPCLLLIGSDINDKENLVDENLEWSLEDEYEYRRRRFYYRCAGINSCYVDSNVSTSDDEDEDDESYKLSANSDFDSGYSLPPREEWAAEKRHWFDLLTRHRAAALDKWIQTAADAKQAVGDVYGYRALMSALCSDRIQALQHAWAALRRLHTATAVAFESRLRPEFLGRREKNLVAAVGNPVMNDIDDNDVNELLQLPPNATIPDATALAVLYEHLYNDNYSDTGSTSTNTTCLDDIGSKKEKDPRLSSLFTSPLLLSPSPWLSVNSGISGGLGSSVVPDYGLSALHVLCIQYSEWIQQSYSNDDSLFPFIKPPMLQLDRFRSNFRALLRQYSESGFDDYDDSNESCNYGLGFKKENKPKLNNTSSHQEINHNRNEDFGYEQQYEDNVEQYGINGGDYDDCGDEDDDDATVIYCSNSSTITTMRSNEVDTCPIAIAEEQRQKTTQNEKCHSLQKDQEEDQYYRWIEDAGAYGQGPAPLNIVFRTELHVRLFWPPTLFLQNGKNGNKTTDHKLAIPAYALGTTNAAIATATYDSNLKFTNHEQSELALNHVITAQLNQAAQDMRLRYKAMDDFLDGACAYSMSVTKIAHEDNTMVGKQQQNCLLPQFE